MSKSKIREYVSTSQEQDDEYIFLLNDFIRVVFNRSINENHDNFNQLPVAY